MRLKENVDRPRMFVAVLLVSVVALLNARNAPESRPRSINFRQFRTASTFPTQRLGTDASGVSHFLTCTLAGDGIP